MIYNKNNDELENYLKNLFKNNYYDFISATQEKPAIRINTLKNSKSTFKSKLDSWGQIYENIGFNTNGIRLNSDDLPLSHTLDYFSGNFYYQGISSQIPVEMMAIQKHDKVLDLTAAPGSKSCQILEKLKHSGFLISNDSSYKRMQPLNVNMQRSGACNFLLLNTWGEKFGLRYNEFFDKVLLDAPCTATGTLAASNEIVNWWNLAKLNKLVKSQFSLIISALKALKVGGEMVYSTCSVTPEENELLIQKILNKYPVEIVDKPAYYKKYFSNGLDYYNDLKLNPALRQAIRVHPHIHGLEGFFSIKLRKLDTIPSINPVKKTDIKNLLTIKDPKIEEILDYISDQWGIQKKLWSHYNYNLTKNRIWIVGEIDEIPSDNFINSGLLLAEKKISGWKLFNNSVTFLRSKITRRIIELEDDKLKELFKKAKINTSGIDNGYYVLARKNKPFASLYVENDTLRIKLPHSFNLVLD